MNDQEKQPGQPGIQPEHEHQFNHEHAHAEDGSCHEMLSTLCDYVDGMLSEELCAEVERHMQDCPRCRIVVDTTRKTIELYREASAQEAAQEAARGEGKENLPADVRERLYVRLNLDDYLKK